MQFGTPRVHKLAPGFVKIPGVLGRCGSQQVFLGFAPASTLYLHSFADVLDEETGRGYQRRFSEAHSLEFRKYIQGTHATTIPLTFNLRPTESAAWKLHERPGGTAELVLNSGQGPALAQVDCQHRLGFLRDVDIPLAFMTFVGLSTKREMEIFSVINGKAKGLSSSLLDYHESKLTNDLGTAKPEIYIALRLNETEGSPWHRRLDLGGDRSVGMRRYASLRTMQKAVRRFLRGSRILDHGDSERAFDVVLSFWRATRTVLDSEWHAPRTHLLTKGIGVYALMSIAADLYSDATARGLPPDEIFFTGALADFIRTIDWSNRGPLRGFGGAGGADQAVELIRAARLKSGLRVVSNAR